jgi:hypothetical protein
MYTRFAPILFLTALAAPQMLGGVEPDFALCASDLGPGNPNRFALLLRNIERLG